MSCNWAEFEKSIQKEADVVTLEAARIVLELSGVLRKYKGKFIIGRDFRAAIEKHGVGGVYPVLFETAARKFNWGFADGLPNLPRIQLFAGFTLRLLTRYGDTPRPDTFYADAFIRAFPAMLNEVRDGAEQTWDTSHGTLSSAFKARVFPVFGHMMGIVHLERPPSAHYDAPLIITATRLLREFVRVHV